MCARAESEKTAVSPDARTSALRFRARSESASTFAATKPDLCARSELERPGELDGAKPDLCALAESENAGESRPSASSTSSCAPAVPAKALPTKSSNALADMVMRSGPSRRCASTKPRVCSPVSRSASASASCAGAAAPPSCVLEETPSTATPPGSISEASIGSSKSSSSVPKARSRRGVASSVGMIPSICRSFENESESSDPGRGRPSTAVSLDASMEPPRSVREERPT